MAQYKEQNIEFNNILTPASAYKVDGPLTTYTKDSDRVFTSNYLDARNTTDTDKLYELFTTNAIDIHWGGADLGTVNGINLGTITTTADLMKAFKVLSEKIKFITSISWTDTDEINGIVGKKPDLGTLTVTYNDGSTSVISSSDANVTLIPTYYSVVDFNNDGAIDIADISGLSNNMTTAIANNDLSYDINGDGAIDVTDSATAQTIISTIMEGTTYDNFYNAKGTWKFVAKYNGVQTTVKTVNISGAYYWYVGTENPLNMNGILPIVSDTSSTGWRKIGSSLPTYSSSNMLWNSSNTISLGSKTTWYLALPSNKIKIYSAGMDLTSSVTTYKGTKVIDNITYYIYLSNDSARYLGYDLY